MKRPSTSGDYVNAVVVSLEKDEAGADRHVVSIWCDDKDRLPDLARMGAAVKEALRVSDTNAG